LSYASLQKAIEKDYSHLYVFYGLLNFLHVSTTTIELKIEATTQWWKFSTVYNPTHAKLAALAHC